MAVRLGAAELAQALADRVVTLVVDLLPGGHREGPEWVCPSAASPFGCSVSVHLTGPKAGAWSAWAAGRRGDALDFAAAVLGVDLAAAMTWSVRWLGLGDSEVRIPRRVIPAREEPDRDPDRWRYPWRSARPIACTLAETYLRTRELQFDDPDGRVLRFAARRRRKSPAGELECHPALLCALADVHSGEQVGIINIHLEPDGRDRLRDKKGKTVTGRGAGAVVMLSDFDEVLAGLILDEGPETGIALYQYGMRPVWACGSSGTLAKFPVLTGVEGLTIAADADGAGLRAATELAQRWREADREVFIIAPPRGDWGDPR